MNILLTGGAGFIGSHIADMLIEQDHKVVIVDNLSSGKEKNLNKKVIFYKIDIRDKDIDKIFKKEEIDCINHHAAQISVRVSTDDPIYDCDINILGSLNLLQHAVKYKVKKFVFASTGGAIYGEQENFPAGEGHSLKPLSPYGIAKLSVEKYLYYFFHAYQLNFTILRYANVYGPRQDPHGEAGVVSIFSNCLLKGEKAIINGDGLQTRDYVFVYDVVSANRLAVEIDNGTNNNTYNVGTGHEVSVNELYARLCKTTKKQSNCYFGPAKAGEQKRSVISSKKLLKEHGWKPGFLLDDGLKITVDYFEEIKS